MNIMHNKMEKFITQLRHAKIWLEKNTFHRFYPKRNERAQK